MKTTRFAFSVAILTLFSACGSNLFQQEKLDLEKDFQRASVESVYALKVPNYMSPTDDLSEEASLQYQNIIRDVYLMVIDENTAEFEDIFIELDMLDSNLTTLQNYADLQKMSIAETMNVTHESEMRPLNINGYEAVMVQVEGGVPEVNTDVTYLLTVLQGKTNLYSILYWTTKENAVNVLPHFEQSVRTFEDL